MFDVQRRSLLRLLGAAGIAPLIPALPARAAALGAPAGASASKALWAGIYAKAGSGARFASVAHGMGLSANAIEGVAARSAGVRLTAGVALEATRARAARVGQSLWDVITSQIRETMRRINAPSDPD